MATTVNTRGKNTAVAALATACTHAAVLNSSNAEPSAGSPAYARKAITFASAANGAAALNGTLPVFDIPAGFTVSKVAYLTATAVATNSFCVDDVTPEAFAAQGTYTLTSGTITLADPA